MRTPAGLLKLVRLWPWPAAALSGFLYAACFPPFDQPWFCWVALAPAIAAVWFSPRNGKRRWLRNLLLGYLTGIISFTVAFRWLGSLGTLFENAWLHGLPLLLAFYLALYFAFWVWFAGLIRPATFVSSWRNLLAAFLGASAWVAQEWIRGWLFGGFGWDGLGVSLHGNWLFIQIAEITGVTGLSFLIAFANIIAVAVPVRLFQEAKTHKMRVHWDINFTVLGIFAVLLFGWNTVRRPSSGRLLQVAAVQANIAQHEKFDPQFTRKIFSQLTRLSEIGLRSSPRPELVVWPESSTPDPVRDPNSESYRFVIDFSLSTRTNLLLGTLDFEDQHVYNAAVLVSAQDQQMQVYRKLHLVPFGEYIPLRKSFPLFAAVAGKWVPGDFDRGHDYTVFALPNQDVRIAPLICFEDTIGELTGHFVRGGANLLVNVTNDGWFLHSAGSQQHLANAIFRCVETRRPMVRAANTGITCFVNEFGRVTQVLQDETGSTFTEGVLVGEVNVPTTGRLTFYVEHGEWFPKLCAAITCLALVLIIAGRWFRRPSPDPGTAASQPP